MTPKTLSNYRKLFVAIVAILVWLLLAWQYFRDGIPAHHLLANPEFPSISNGWGALLIPILAAYLAKRIETRLTSDDVVNKKNLNKILLTFGVSVFYAISLGLAFTFKYDDVSSFLFIALLVLAMIFPLFQAQYYLGYVLGLVYFFGTVLPILVGGVIVLLSAIANFGLHPIIFWIYKRARGN